MKALEVLRCTKCDAPLVLADSEQVTCPSCGTVNPVPEAYRALHRARLADKAAIAEAEQALRRLDRPAWMVTKVLARVFDKNMFVFVFLYGIPLFVFAVQLALRVEVWFPRHFHYASGDDMPFGYFLAVILGVMFVAAFVPRAFGVYANRRVADRTRVLAAVAARRPAVPGAASECRICGAPLAVAKDAIVAVCSYCGAQNAVHLETKIAADTKLLTAAVGTEMRDAERRDDEERAGTRRLLGKELGRYTLRTALLFGAVMLASQENADKSSTTLGIIGIIATLVLFTYYVLRSMAATDEDAEERRSGNDAPEWVGWVGPLIVLGWLYFRH